MLGAQDHAVTKVVILGGGTAGWMTAAALSRLLPESRCNIHLVESDAIGTVGVGEATLPHLRFFNQRLGIDEKTFIQQTNATIKLGIEFSNWRANGHSYIHPFGDYGADISGIPFHHVLLKHQQADALSDYSPSVQMCYQQKFAIPNENGDSLLNQYGYAYHIDAGKYANFLRQFAESIGVKRTEGKVVDVLMRASNGDISGIILTSGERIKGDFFIDCSGFSGRLIEQAMQAGYEDWTHWLPCNRAWAVPCERDSAPLPYTKSIARDAGWQWQIPLQNRMGNGIVFCDDFVSSEIAVETLMSNLPGKPTADPKQLKFITGKRKKMWVNNCVAIGLSGGFLEPLESTSIQLIQAAIMKLVDLFPDNTVMQAKANTFNQHMDNEMHRVKDFLILHYHATERTDTEFWRHCRDMSIPASLQERLAIWKESAAINPYKNGLFLFPSWLAVLLGQGVKPDHTDFRAACLKAGEVNQLLSNMSSDIQQHVSQLPTHEQFIAYATN